MAEDGKNQEKQSILEDIYDENKIQTPAKFSFKDYFQNKEKVNKLLSGSVLVLGLAAVVLGFFQFRYNIVKYFIPSEPEDISLEDQNPSPTDQDLLGLRQKDTDKDGLSDYDELYIYSSSPYIQDTDSDGVSDQQEIARGTDPNCPEGQNCFAIREFGSSEEQEDFADLFLGGQSQIDQLRARLLQSGFSEAELDGFSDAELLEAYRQVLFDSGVQEDTSPPQVVELPVSDIQDLTPDQLRQLLREAGISDEILNNISDEDLLQLVQDSLISN